MSTETRLGFIGLSPSTGGSGAGGSWAAKSHLPYLQSDRNAGKYKIAALQNSTKASAESAASKFGLGDVKCYGNAQDIANSDVDIVAVSVNVPSHYDAVMPALKAGKDVFVEWPLARNLAEAEEVTQLAREKGVRTLVGLQARQNPSVLAVKKLVESGDLGEILGSTMHGYGLVFGAVNPKSFAYGFPVEAGANLLTIPCGHAIDAMCYVLGEMNYVSATLANRRPKFQVADGDGKIVGEDTKTAHDYITVSGTLQKSGGVVSVVYEGGQNPSGGPGFFWQINGTKGTVVLEGDTGHLQMYQPKVRLAKAGEEAKDLDVKWVGADFGYAVGEAWNAFAGKGDGHVTTFEDALLRHKMIEAIYKSNDSGRRESYI